MAVVAFSVYLLKAERKIPVTYPKRNVSDSARRRLQSSPSLPLRLNGGYVLAVTAAIGIMAVPEFFRALLASHSWAAGTVVVRVLSAWTSEKTAWYWLSLACLMVVFTYFYNIGIVMGWTSLKGLPIAEKLKKEGAYIPGFRPGQMTQKYLLRITRAISLPGGLALAFLLAGMPYIILRLTGVNTLVTMLSVVVMVGTVGNLRGYLEMYKGMESYAGLLRRAGERT